MGLYNADGSATLAVIPLGTANDLARSLELNDRERALRALTHGRTRKLDLINVNLDGVDPRNAVNAVITGAGARLSQGMNEDMKGSWGALSYRPTPLAPPGGPAGRPNPRETGDRSQPRSAHLRLRRRSSVLRGPEGRPLRLALRAPADHLVGWGPEA